MFLTKFDKKYSLERLTGLEDDDEQAPDSVTDQDDLMEDTVENPEMPDDGQADLTQDDEIVDYVPDDDDETPIDTTEIEVQDVDADAPDEDVIDDVDDDMEGVEDLHQQVRFLKQLHGAIEKYGISPGMMAVADRQGLLSSTFHQIPSTESMQGNYSPASKTTQLALEGIGEAIKSKMAEWASKIGSVGKSIASGSLSVLKRLCAGAGHLVASAGRMVWDGAKATGRAIKAHPYRTVVIVLGAIAACFGMYKLVLAYPKEASQVAGWWKKFIASIKNIKWPFKKAKAPASTPDLMRAADHLSDSFVGSIPPAPDVPIAKVGWTKAAFSGCAKSFKELMDKIHFADMAKSTAGKTALVAGAGVAAGANTMAVVGYFRGAWMVLKIYWRMIKAIIFGGARLVMGTLGAIVRLMGGGRAPEAEPAEA